MTDLRKYGHQGLNLLNATDAAQQIAAGHITSHQLVTDCLQRIQERDPRIGAWKFLDPDLPLAQARACDEGERTGPLLGVPVGIKDNFDTKDMPTEYGTAVYPGHRPQADTESVAALRRAGAVILGKTVTSEFAGPYPGQTLNPHDTTRSPGVSSMGSAAGVADFMMPLANGTQTGGSVIRPAALCGIYGYKGSFNHLDGTGVRHIKPSIDTLGHFGRSLDDIELMRTVLVGETFSPLAPPSVAPRIGICRTSEWHAANPETVAMIDFCDQRLRVAGGQVVQVDLPPPFTKVMERSFDVIRMWELLTAHADEIEHHLTAFNPWFQSAVEQARGYSETDFTDALEEAAAVRELLAGIFEGVDILLTPSALGIAPTNLLGIEPHNFNYLWTLMYTPCISLPAFTGPQRLPVGLQVIGPRNADRTTLELAHWIDNAIQDIWGTYPVALEG